MTEWETIDFNNHIQVASFLQKQSDRIKELEEENGELYCSIDFLQSENKHLQECILQNNELKQILKNYALAEEKWGKGNAILVLNEKVRRLIE